MQNNKEKKTSEEELAELEPEDGVFTKPSNKKRKEGAKREKQKK